jgi:hypothetical protein
MMKGIGSICLVFALALIVATGVGFAAKAGAAELDANYGMGKMEIRSQAIGQSLRLTLPMLIPWDIAQGERAYAGMTWTNVWARDREFLLDYEMLDTLLAFGFGFENRWGVGMFIDHRAYFGGAMDSFIEGFHDWFGIDQDGRDQAPSGRSVIEMYDPDTGAITVEIPADKLSNTGLSLVLNHNFEFDHPLLPSLNIYGVARYPLQSPDVFEKNTSLDYGLGLGLSKRWFERWHTYAVLGYTWYADRGKTDPGNVTFENYQWIGLFAIGWQYSTDFNVIAQYVYGSAVIKTLEALDKASHEVHLGFRWRLDKAYMVDFALIENIITMDNSPDFGLHLGLNAAF